MHKTKLFILIDLKHPKLDLKINLYWTFENASEKNLFKKQFWNSVNTKTQYS